VPARIGGFASRWIELLDGCGQISGSENALLSTGSRTSRRGFLHALEHCPCAVDVLQLCGIRVLPREAISNCVSHIAKQSGHVSLRRIGRAHVVALEISKLALSGFQFLPG